MLNLRNALYPKKETWAEHSIWLNPSETIWYLIITPSTSHILVLLITCNEICHTHSEYLKNSQESDF